MTTGKTQGYTLKFRCINCGKNEVFASHPTENVVDENELRAQIYPASCNFCGWRGDVCGFSAILVARTDAPKAKAAGQAN